MSKRIVSGAVALLMVLVPVGASALSYEIPAIPQNPSVQQLQQLIVQLTTLLQQIIAARTSPLPTPPYNCPVYNAPLCAPGEHLVGGDYLPNGCQAAPRCVPDTETPVGGASISFVGISGATYRIGDTVDWTINYFNAPSDSNICLVITSDSSTWEGGFQGFGGSDGCYWASGNGSRTFRAVLGPKPGFDFTAGNYHLSAKLIKAATGHFQPYATNISGSFTVLPAIGQYPGDITVSLTGPANGTVYKVGDMIPVTYSYTGAPPNSQIIIKTENIQASNPPSGNVSGGSWQSPILTIAGSGTYTWQTGPSMTDFTGTYRITAIMRQCDPRGCSWNADFPGQQSNVSTWVSAPSPITITLNSALSGSQAGTLSITQSESPAPQTVAAGSEVWAANYFLSAGGEDIRITAGHFTYTDNMAVDPTSCSLYDAGSRVSSMIYPIYTAQGATGNYAVTFSPGIVVPRGATKTLSMRCMIPSNAQGSFKWGLAGGAYFAAQGVSSGVAINANVTAHSGNTMTVNSSGAFTVSTDASSPGFQTVQGGSTNVTMGVYKFRATGESIGLTRLGLKLTSGSTQDIVTVRIYSGATQVGQATFVGNSTVAASTLFSTFAIQKDYDTTLTIRADIAPIGLGQPGTAGDIVKIDVDASNTRGTGISSGMNVTAVGTTAVAGVALAGATQTSNPRVTLGSVSRELVYVNYYDLPANSQFVLINQTSGARVDGVSGYSQNGGSGSFSVPVPQGMPSGTYYVKVQNYSSLAYIAQTVSFTYSGSEMSGTPTIRVTDATRPYIRFHIDNLPTSDVQGVFLAGATTGTNVAYTTTISSSGDGYVNMNSVSPGGQYYLKLLAVNNNRLIAQSSEFPIAPTQSAAPTCTINVSPASVVQGQSVTVSWTSANATAATFNGGTVQTNGSQTMTWLAGAGQFSMPLVVTGTGGSATCNASINATAVSGTLTADIKANGSNGPISITSGQTATISWTSTGAALCSISPSAQSYWAGNYGLSGSKDSGVLTQSNTYTLHCQGNGSQTITDTVTVNVTAVPPPPPAQVSCTYTPILDKDYGTKYTTGTASTINIEGGQAACASWCSSQAAEMGVRFSCSYNGQLIAIIKRESNLASALTALEGAVQAILAYLK